MQTLSVIRQSTVDDLMSDCVRRSDVTVGMQIWLGVTQTIMEL